MYRLTPRSIFAAIVLLVTADIFVNASGDHIPLKIPKRLSGKSAQLQGPIELSAMHPLVVSESELGAPCAYLGGVSTQIQADHPPLEITPLIVSGPSNNRVDLSFSPMATCVGKEKFIEDAGRLAQDVSRNQTFNSVKPLLNFWAAFSPSNESGIGVGGVPKEDGTELRGVYYSKPEVAKAACDSLEEQSSCLVGNDPLYGGLGGEFTVITSSLLNGPLVLRHELGIQLSMSAKTSVPWAKWLTNPPNSDSNSARVERSVMPMQAYPWTMLNTSTSWSVKFQSSGTYARHLVRFSLSGLPEKTDLKVELDGADLNWVPVDIVGLDRWHYDIHVESGLGGGVHELRFTLLNGDREGVAQLCSAEILEFGGEDEFVSTPGHYSLFPTYSETNETSYRPTNEDCLMRIVTQPNLCKVCLEGLWFSLLRRVDLIDNVTEGCVEHNGSLVKTIDLSLVPLAHLREEDEGAFKAKESYTITWRRVGEVLKEFTNMTRIEVDNELAVAQYTISVEFATEEVREESDLLKASLSYNVLEKCL
ncbi:hypothetical protein BDQ17DRAFT_1423958 [Cyathus striatus]|nr:hypothetical protein BDQ17DRAFT_1423958 [Cyathus striatus]